MCTGRFQKGTRRLAGSNNQSNNKTEAFFAKLIYCNGLSFPLNQEVGFVSSSTIPGNGRCPTDCNNQGGGLLQPWKPRPRLQRSSGWTVPARSGPGEDCCSPEALPEFCGIQAQSLNGVIDCWKQFVVKPGLCVRLSGLPGGIKFKRCPLGFLCEWTDSLQFERAGLENHQVATPHSPEFGVAIAPVFQCLFRKT